MPPSGLLLNKNITAEKQRRNKEVHREDAEIKKYKGDDTMEVNQITSRIIGAAVEVHRVLGPGLLESAYEECLCRELALQNLPFQRQLMLPVEYKGMHLDCGYRLDILACNLVVVELKSVESLMPVHEAQLLTYLKLGGWNVGLLINFNVPMLKNGLRRIVHGLKEDMKSPTPASKRYRSSASSASLR